MQITCPYCFAKFEDSQVIFRSNTGFTREELDSDTTSSATVKTLKQRFLKYDPTFSTGPNLKIDMHLRNFWANRGKESGYISADPGWNLPHIDPADEAAFKAMTVQSKGHLSADQKGFVRDADGFIRRVLDPFSDPSIPMARLCPHCSNPLPLPDYGKYPVMFISVVGITTAGKTVYLNQLLTNFSSAMLHSGYTIGVNNLASIGEEISPYKPLPSSTDDKTMRRPLAVTMQRRDNPSDGLTIVFYDIAGENCVSLVDAQGHVKENTGVGNFIAFCDGLLFLIAPTEILLFNAGNGEPRDLRVNSVVDYVLMIRSSINVDHPTWEGIPVAAVLTKSDNLNNVGYAPIPSDSLIFRNVSHISADGHPIQGFVRDEFVAINNELQTMFSAHAADVAAALESFTQRAYFAVSAITCGVQSRFEMYQNTYVLDSENDRKLKELQAWVDGWNDRTPDTRPYYSPCPVRKSDGSPIQFLPVENITKNNSANIETEITAECLMNGHVVNQLRLKLWDACEEVNLLGYPAAQPNPRRVEEPIQWILWQKHFLAPYYQSSPEPTFGFLTSRSRREQILQQWRDEEYSKSKAFYEGK